jgi:ATP-binding cassette, subfamily C, bacterial CydD
VSSLQLATESKPGATVNSVQHRLLTYCRRGQFILYGAISAGFLATVIVVLQAWLLSDVVSGVFKEAQTLSDVSTTLWIMLALAVVRAGFLWIGDLGAQRSASLLKHRLRTDLTQHLFALGPAYARSERSGELVHATVQGVEDLDEYVTVYQPLRFLAFLVPVFVALIVLIIDPLTVLVLLFTGPILVLLLALIGSRAKAATEQRFAELSWMSAHFLDMLQGLVTLKMFGRSREQVDNVQSISRNYGNTTMVVLRTAFETAFVLELSTTIATALVAVEVSLRLMEGAISFQRALALLIITPEFFAPLRQLAAKYHAGAAGKAAAGRIFAILDTPLAPNLTVAPKANLISVQNADIRFEQVTFMYDSGQRLALRDLSLNIPRGRRVALVGATGAGKTTVANLLLRFFDPDSGSITVGGVPLTSIEPAAWRSQLAWVPQHPHLFYGTVEDNIRIAKPSASYEEIVAAATAACADTFIERLPGGFSTPIGENGIRLSGGERQRLAIARAFLRDAPLLVLDEPTSHLDPESESLINDALSRLLVGRTAVIISHRMKLANTSDLVYIMHQGRLIDAGHPAKLIEDSGHYQRLYLSHEGGVA